MAFTATARPANGGLRHEVEVNGRHSIVTDEPANLGGTDLGPAPHELLAAAVASCVSTMVSLYAKRKSWDVSGLSVDVSYDNESDPKRVEVRLHLPESLDRDQVERLERVAETCPVRRALEGEFVFRERVVAP